MFNPTNQSALTYRKSGLSFTRSGLTLSLAILLGVSSSAFAQTAHLSNATTQNFGSVNVGTASSTATLTFTFDTAGVLGSTAVVTQGVAGLDFADAGTGSCKAGTSYAVGATCTIKVAFRPTRPGTRYGAALLYDGSGTAIATAYLQGSGSGPQVNFLPSTESTIPASGISGPNGIAADAAGNIYLVDSNNGRVLKETLNTGAFTQSTIVSGLDYPTGVAVDGSGNVYVASWGLDHLLKETPVVAGGYSQSAIGSGLAHPNGITVDGLGNVYVADWNNYRVVKETLSAGSYTQSVVLTGEAFSGVVIDASGNLYMSAYSSSQVITLSTSNVQGTIGSGFDWASYIAIDGVGNLYIVGTFNNAIFKETPTGGTYTQSTVATSPLNTPYGVAVDGSGNVYISDAVNDRVLEENFSNPPSLSFTPTAIGTTSSDSPQTVTLENAGNAPLTFPVPGSGNNPNISANYTLNSSGASACPLVATGASATGTLAAGATCLLPISYSPTAATPVNGTLMLTDSNLNATAPAWAAQTISLSGGIGKLTSRTTINASAVSVNQGQSITLTVTVATASGAATPTGTVTISAVSVSSAFTTQTLTLNSAGVATWTSSTLADGAYELTASYSGDSSYSAGSSINHAVFHVFGPPVNLLLIYGGNEAVYGGVMPRIVAEVTDSAGDGLPGVTITMGGAGLVYQNTTLVTDSDGYAWPVERAIMTGALVATATVSGIAAPTTYSILVYPAPLTITVRPTLSLRLYGTANPTFSATATGLVNGDTLGGTLTVSESTTATIDSGVGVYPVTAALSGSSASYYTVTAVAGSLKIEPAPLTIVAKDEGVVYGQTPKLPIEYKLYGFVNGDNSSVVSGAPILTTTVTSTTQRGVYPIDVQVGTLSAANYKFVTAGPPGGVAAVQVYKAPLTVTANTVTMTEGGAVPALSYTISGFVNGEDASVVSGTASLTTSVTANTKVGEYPITMNVSDLSAEDYYFIPAVHGGVVKVVK
jgi:sugar lactone lactonase YvrE